MKPEDHRERLLARISDLLRRSGVEDAEALIVDLEQELDPMIPGTGSSFAMLFHAELPAARFPNAQIVPFFRPEFCGHFASPNVFPFAFTATRALLRILAGTETEALRANLIMREMLDPHTELARHPARRFCGRKAVPFEREYQPASPAGLDLYAPAPFQVKRPWSVTLTLFGFR